MEGQKNSALCCYCFAKSHCLFSPESGNNMNVVSSRMKVNVPEFKDLQE